jgi:catechol 2,3-dioxygenase-like lactoylglutathione lyase family enzyme
MKIPTYGTMDHFGLTVPDLDSAVDFFVSVLGAELWYQEGPFSDPDGDSMWNEMHVPSRSIERLAMLRVGSSATIELLEFSRAGETDRDAPDLTGHSVAHIGLRVSDLDSAAEYLREADGVEVLSGPTTVEKGLAKGLRWIFFVTPWGLSMELVEFPPGMSV